MTDASPESQCLAERSAATGYVVIVSTSLGDRGKMRAYTTKPRGQSALSMVEAYSVGSGAICWLWRQRQKRGSW